MPGSNRFAVAEPFIVPQSRFQDDGRVDSVDDPLRTITAAGGRCFGLAEPSLIKYYGNESGAQSVNDPIDTVTTKDRHALVEPFVIKTSHAGANGNYVRSVEEPIGAITGETEHAIVEPFIMSAGGPEVGPRPVSEPANTVLTRDHMALVDASVEPFISLQKSNSAPRSIDEPIPTLCAGEHIALVEPCIVTNRNHSAPRSVDEPIPVLTTGNNIALVQPVINGMALDIHFRMLQPRELARAMSFPDDYEFVGTREAVVKQIGNAWAGELAKALCMSALQSIVKAPKKPRRERAA